MKKLDTNNLRHMALACGARGITPETAAGLMEEAADEIDRLRGAARSATVTPSWVPLAAKRTRETIEHAGHIPWTFEGDPCGGQHIDYMLAELESGRISGNKAHRWLGWVQAIACEKGDVSLEALKAINKTASATADGGAA